MGSGVWGKVRVRVMVRVKVTVRFTVMVMVRVTVRISFAPIMHAALVPFWSPLPTLNPYSDF